MEEEKSISQTENTSLVMDFNYYRAEAEKQNSLIEKCMYMRTTIEEIKLLAVDVEDDVEKERIGKLLEKFSIIHQTVKDNLAEENIDAYQKSEDIVLIEWASDLNSLTTLLELMIDSQLLPDNNYNQISDIIAAHFNFKGKTDISNVDSKLRWGKSLALLAFLICKLDKKRYLGSKKNQLSFSKHFTDSKGYPIANTAISNALDQIKNRNDRQVPKGHYIVDNIFKVLEGKLLKSEFTY